MNASISPRVAAYAEALDFYRRSNFEEGKDAAEFGEPDCTRSSLALDGTAALLLAGAPFRSEDEAALAVILIANRVGALIDQFRIGERICVDADFTGEVSELEGGLRKVHEWFADREGSARLADVADWHLSSGMVN